MAGDGNGQLWKLDSNLVWQRQDKTFFMGYDYHGALLMPHMKYGGYGYWRTSGLLFVFQELSREWQAIPLTRELPVYGSYCYHVPMKGVMMQSGSIILQSSLKNEYIIKDSLFELEMMNKEWRTRGALNPEAKFFLWPIYLLPSVESPTGRFLYTSDSCALVDYHNLTCTIPNSSSQIAFRKLHEGISKGQLLVSTASGLLAVDTTDFSIVDSISWSEMTGQPARVIPILKPEEAAVSNLSPPNDAYVVGVAIIVVGGGLWLFFKRRRKAEPRDRNDSSVTSADHPDTALEPGPSVFRLVIDDEAILLNGKSVHEQLTDPETQLLRNLIEKKRSDLALTTIQFNELLGIDSRSPDNQKKIRSETVKGVNVALNKMGFPDEDVRRIRHPEDRRMMMYFLHDSFLV